ncbi:MAG: metallophosphoesterase [Nanoarchaeota archaeon]|nr:metallophosphoesterase [Nanoarchaeota archaeon]MBU4116143.1 metallophosphoesterase [Nanoarchaeota archaeon]
MRKEKKSKKKEKRKKTRILAIGDIHGDKGLVKRLAEKAKKEKIDLVILTGDLTFAEKSTKDLIGPFIKAKKQVLLIHGNHESLATADFLAEMYPPTKNLHGYAFKKNGLGIFGAGGADMGVYMIQDSEIFNILKQGHERIKNSKKKIMVTHMHPKGSKAEFTGFPGSAGIRKAIKKFKPDIAICSHIHEASGIEEKIGKTRVINVSKKENIFEV